MNTQTVYLPFSENCTILAFVEASYRQLITVTDLETNTTLLAWEAQGEGTAHAPVSLHTGTAVAGRLGYRIEVKIESSPNAQQPWQPSRVAMFSGGRAPWAYCTVGSEDCGSTDNDWNDASVAFVL